jgi:two-component system, chemotaxis family, CheB/CheR fusion protein
MQAVGVKTYSEFAQLLEQNPAEFDQLCNTVLINVTAFFRDGVPWDALASTIVPRILESKGPEEPIRVWSAGCASGEEAYTLAIVLAEALGPEAFRSRVKIYATDVDEQALTLARHAAYDAKQLEGVPPELVEKYFARQDSRYTFRKDLRRLVIFGRNDLVQDAPISRIDLLVCRNTLMYFNGETQTRIIARFHFALNNGGFLFLGKSEMLLSHGDLFATVDLEHRVFEKVAANRAREQLLPLQRASEGQDVGVRSTEDGHRTRMRELAFDAVPVSQLVVDRNGRVVLASEVARQTFQIAPSDVGKPLQDLEISFRPLELRSLIQKVYGDHQAVAVGQVKRPKADGATQYFDVQITPLGNNDKQPVGVAVSFVDVTQAQELQAALERVNQDRETANEELQSANEELETTNEELQSTNEELETTNEELQSTNEELETMNEELQATNEELETTNDELQVRTEELNQANAFLHAVLGSLKVGIAVINSRFEVIAWNDKAQDLWGVSAKEAQGRSIFDLGIGLPLEKVIGQIRACLNGKKQSAEMVLQSTNRRGKPVACKVICKVYTGTDAKRGVTIVMEQG